MFKKVRIKLAIVNMGIIIAILLVVFSFVFISMRTTLTRQVTNIKRTLEEDKGISQYYDQFLLKPGSKPERSKRVFGGMLIVIEEDQNGAIINNITSESSISLEETKELYELVKNKKKDMKYVKLDDKYYITFFIEKETTKYYFIEATQERDIITAIKRELIYIFLGSVLLVLVGNLIMTKKAIEPIKKAWERQKQFVGDASHELRTPISAIKTNMEIVSEDYNKTIGEQKKWVENVNEETKRMGNLVNKLLFLSRKDSEDNSSSYEIINLGEEIEVILKEFAIKFNNKNIAVESSLMNTFIEGDKTDIYQLVSSILDNALKYTKEGKVIIKLYEDTNYSILEISDTGIGIAKEEQAKVFERFYRADKIRNKMNGGYGLGLSIVKSIVDDYKGKIELKSTLSKGSTFIIKIPTMEQKGKILGK